MKQKTPHLGIDDKEFFDYPDFEKFDSNNATIENSQSGVSNDNSDSVQMSNTDYLVAFATSSENYCVGVVDMINSTKISAVLGNARTTRYYQIFLNSMAKILCRFGGCVIKNIGDCLLYYFPESNNTERKFGFISSLECMLAMTEAKKYISVKLHNEGLPDVDYRISADYGPVIIMKANNSSNPDMIGPPVNMCTKINRLASKNGIVIGGDLYHMVKKLNDYSFKSSGEYSLGFKQSYPVYSVFRKE